MAAHIVDEAEALITYLSYLSSLSCSSVTFNISQTCIYQTHLHFPTAALPEGRCINHGYFYIPESRAAISVARHHASIHSPLTQTPPPIQEFCKSTSLIGLTYIFIRRQDLPTTAALNLYIENGQQSRLV